MMLDVNITQLIPQICNLDRALELDIQVEFALHRNGLCFDEISRYQDITEQHPSVVLESLGILTYLKIVLG